MTQRQRTWNGTGKIVVEKMTTIKKVDPTIAIDVTRATDATKSTRTISTPHYTSSDNETKNDDKNTYVNNDDTSKLTASSDANDDNFVVALGTWAKGEKKSKRVSAVAKKEVVAPCKRKSVAVTVPHEKKKVNSKIIESDSNDDDDDNFLASCKKALKCDPLDI